MVDLFLVKPTLGKTPPWKRFVIERERLLAEVRRSIGPPPEDKSREAWLAAAAAGGSEDKSRAAWFQAFA